MMFDLISFLVVPQCHPVMTTWNPIGASQFLQSLHSCQAGSWLSGRGESPILVTKHGHVAMDSSLYSEWEVIYKSLDTNVHGWFYMIFSLSDCQRVCDFHCLKSQEHQKPLPTETEVGHVEFIFEAPNFDPHPVQCHLQASTHLTVPFYKLSSGNKHSYWKWWFIVDLPIYQLKMMDLSIVCKRLPEGITNHRKLTPPNRLCAWTLSRQPFPCQSSAVNVIASYQCTTHWLIRGFNTHEKATWKRTWSSK